MLLGFEFRGRLLLEINTSPLPPTKQLPRNEAIEPMDIVRGCVPLHAGAHSGHVVVTPDMGPPT